VQTAEDLQRRTTQNEPEGFMVKARSSHTSVKLARCGAWFNQCRPQETSGE
jgi:hypothetical protein